MLSFTRLVAAWVGDKNFGQRQLLTFLTKFDVEFFVNCSSQGSPVVSPPSRWVFGLTGSFLIEAFLLDKSLLGELREW